MLREAWERLESAIMPRRCVFCGAVSRAGESLICAGCSADLPRVNDPRPAPPFTRVVAPLGYEFPVDAAIKAMKFRRKLYYLPAFGGLLQDACSRLPGTADSLLAVPLHWRRHALRGFNQSVELCKYVQVHTGLPVLNGMVRHRSTPYQSGLDAAQRNRNLANAFRLKNSISTDHVVIVDDVFTTGATASAIARVLFRGGASHVSVLVVARA